MKKGAFYEYFPSTWTAADTDDDETLRVERVAPTTRIHPTVFSSFSSEALFQTDGPALCV